MDKAEWKERIIRSCEEVGTYKSSFDDVIDVLAGIMARRDEAEILYEEMGAMTVVEHTNKGGSTNIVKNPALVVIDDMNKTALAYWRDLGLTPAGLKRIKEFKLQDEGKKSALEVALEELTKD